jgi:predicted adenylyl cyclase CyaB
MEDGKHMTIEVETRAFISESRYKALLDLFGEEGESIGKDHQVTYYFDCEHDLRIQKNDRFSKIWMKKGRMHDEQREEIEVRTERDRFDALERIFTALGYGIDIKWFRDRHRFMWQGLKVCVDYTKGYGYIVEFERMADEGSKDEALRYIRRKMEELGIEETPKEVFREKYEFYRKNWKVLTS